MITEEPFFSMIIYFFAIVCLQNIADAHFLWFVRIGSLNYFGESNFLSSLCFAEQLSTDRQKKAKLAKNWFYSSYNCLFFFDRF